MEEEKVVVAHEVPVVDAEATEVEAPAEEVAAPVVESAPDTDTPNAPAVEENPEALEPEQA